MGPILEPSPMDSEATRVLLDRVAGGDAGAVDELLRRHRPALVAFVGVHLDATIQSKFDASDIVQDAQAEMARRLSDYLLRRPMPFPVWARKTAYERLLKSRRSYRTGRRAVARERGGIDRSSAMLVQTLVSREPTPSEDACAKEFAGRIARAVESLSRTDREMLFLHQTQGLSHEEIGHLLGIDGAAARKRYGRALFRLQKAMGTAGPRENDHG